MKKELSYSLYPREANSPSGPPRLWNERDFDILSTKKQEQKPDAQEPGARAGGDSVGHAEAP